MGTNFNVGSFNAINTNEPKKSNQKMVRVLMKI